jgi:23S rRNA (guanosine2251-2'-O)-methyltransferase
LFGPYVIEELLRNRVATLREVWLQDQPSPRLVALREQVEARGVRLLSVSRRELDALAPGATHQGAVAWYEGYEYASLDEVVWNREGPCLAAVLDCITDPQNLGTLLRGAAWFGLSGVVIPKDRAAPITPAAIKASAGAAFRVKVAREVNLARVLDELNDQGVLTVGAVLEEGAPAPWELDLRGACALVIGAEDRGLRPLVRRKCARVVQIPGMGGVESLNAAQAATALFYEAARQRKTPKG